MSEPTQTTEANTNADGQQSEAEATSQVTEATTPAEEGTPSEGAPEAQGDEPQEDTSRGAPETYQFRDPDGLPDGAKVDEDVLSAFADAARELDLSQEAAQGVVDKVMPKLFEKAEAEQAAVVEKWKAQVDSDPEIGGDKLKPALDAARTAMQKLGTPELKQLLDGPIGNHPELVRFMVRVGRHVSEDMTGRPGNVSQETPRRDVDLNDDAALAEKFYGRRS